MAGEPKISIVTVCYNHERYIAETIESVLSQKSANVEYIVIDDGSTDGSWDVIQRYRDDLAYCERLDGYRKLPISSINYGFSKSTGNILGWLNSKNVLLPNSLHMLGRVFQHFSKIDWITGLATTIDQEGDIVNVRPCYKNIYDFLIGNWSFVQQESTFWRRSLWEQAGPLKESDGWGFDQGLWVSFFQYAQLYHVQTVFGAYRAIPQAVSVQKKQEYLLETERVIKKLRQNVGKERLRTAFIYQICYHARCVLRNIPNTLYTKFPWFNQFAHNVIEYEPLKQNWRLRKKNPFKLYL